MINTYYLRLSFLGLLLMAASSVIAAILSKSSIKVITNGHIEISTIGAPVNTCKAGWVTGLIKCDYTVTDGFLTHTTIPPAVTSMDGITTLTTNTGNLPTPGGTLVTTP